MSGRDEILKRIAKIKSARMGLKGLDLEENFGKLTDKYFVDIPPKEKETLLSRINQDNEVRYVSDPFEFLSTVDDAYPSDSPEHNRGKLIVENLLNKLKGNDSSVSKDLAKLLDKDNTDVKIIIRECKGRFNGNAALKKAKNIGEKNQVIIAMSSAAIYDYPKEMPGLLSHEAAHLLDFTNRSEEPREGYLTHTRGCETFADATGQILAENAGLDCRPFGKFMGDHYRTTNIEFEDSPRGNVREDTINQVYKSFHPDGPTRDNTEQRNSFINNAKQGSVIYASKDYNFR